MEFEYYRPEELRIFCQEVFARLGMAQEDARVVADSLVHDQATSRGIDRCS